MRPLFLLSLPRAGSTLVQRVLGQHPQIATVPEPWLLLPLVYATRPQGARAEFWHESAALGIQEFAGRLDGGGEAYREELAAFATRLYERAGGAGKAYFLDKTPRYHAIAAELPALFPEARFVYLWRQPLAVVASLLETFRLGRFEPYHFGLDLYAGVERLVEAHRAAPAERTHGVRYEDLVAGDEAPWRALFAFLELDFDPALLDRIGNVRLEGLYGDPTGQAQYDGISAEPLTKWQRFAAGPVRRRWSERYLDWIGEERMAAMGYDLATVRQELARARGGRRHPRAAAADLKHLLDSRSAFRARREALELAEGPQPLGVEFE